MILSAASMAKLDGVHPDLRRVMLRAVQGPLAFVVTEGMRTLERQKKLVAAGASQTLHSRHLTGHAVDVAPIISGQVRWDWPAFYPLAAQIKQAAGECDVQIEWGGDWIHFKDGPHFQLPERLYP